MKKMMLIVACIAAFTGCKKSSSTSDVVYHGVILHTICCQDVIETIGPYYLGNAWVDSNDQAYPSYSHVFKVANPCQFGVHNVGDTISFTIISQQVQNCACCNIAIYTPATSYPIHVN